MRFLQHKSSSAKRGLSVLCILALCLGLMPTAAFAADGDKTIMLGTSQLQGGQLSQVYFGTYQQSSAGSTEPDGTEGVDWIKSDTAINKEQGPYYYIDPVKWRVLENADGQLFLLSDQNLDVFQYHTDDESVTWEKSTMRSWLNGYGASENTGGDNGTDYTSDNFIDTAFSKKEQAAIADTTVGNDDNPDWDTEGGNNTSDIVFLLSIAEATNGSYFAEKSSRISTNTAYVAGGGKTGSKIICHNGIADNWWLRSPGFDVDCAADVDNYGSVENTGYLVYRDYIVVRPAFHLDLNSVLFTSAAEGGKAGDGELTAVAEYDGSEWKLTLKDDEYKSFNASAVRTATKIIIDYSDAQTGNKEYLSAMVTDSSGNVTHYGRVKHLTDILNANGTAEINLSGVTMNSGDKLYVFNEQYNGDKMTDYASELKEVTIPSDINAYDVSTKLTNLTSNGEVYVKMNEAYTATLTADSGYELPESINVSVDNTVLTVGKDYTYNNTSGSITIMQEAIKGAVTIEADAVPTFTLTVNLNGGSGSTTGGDYVEGKVVTIDAGNKAGYRFAGWTASNGDGSFGDASSASTTFTMPAADTTITAKWTVVPSGPSTYQIVFDSDITGGTVTASPRWAARGDTVYLTVTADEGYELSTLSVSDRNGDAITLNNEGGGVYSFTMPIGRVTVTATFDKAVITLPFTDVNADDWYYEPVCFVYSQGLMTGTSADTFEPNTSLSRAMLVAVLHRLEGSPAASGGDFNDVASGDWYAEAVNWAASVGVVNGMGGGIFQPNAAITREQMAAILRNYAAYKGMDVSTSGDLSAYSDAASVSDWAEDSVAWAVGQGLIHGMSVDTLEPQGLSTRAQVATVLMNAGSLLGGF